MILEKDFNNDGIIKVADDRLQKNIFNKWKSYIRSYD